MKRAGAVVIRSLGAFGLLFAVTPAFAADPLPPTTARLEYTRPPGCPSERDLRYEVSRRLGQDPSVDEGGFRVVATITRQKNTLAGSLEIYDGDGHSIVHKHTSYPVWDCATLVSGMAIAISVRLDPPLLPPAPEKAPLPLPPPPPKEETPPAQVKPPAPVPTRLRGVVGLSPQVVFGAVGTTFGLVGHLGVRWPVFSPEMAFSLGAEFRYDAPSSAVVEDRPGVSVQQNFLLGGSLVSCLHWRSLFGCALASGGVVSIASTGIDNPAAASPALGYVRAGARFGFEQPLLPWLALRFHCEGLVALRPLYVAKHGVDLRTPVLSFPLSGSVALSLVIFFGGSR